ncbi:MAG: SCO family protein, partial [Rhodospirillales bacterium]|nr:SCO family protein [Rhodospirillales bacterium]
KPPRTESKMHLSKRHVSVILAAVAVILIGSAYGDILFNRFMSLEVAKPRPPQVEFGGPFSLVDHTGKAVTDQSFRGSYMLIYFGYTFCPDVCPTGLQNIANTVDLLGDRADMVKPIFISVDPERDTPDILSGYVSAFHPRMAGLTGTLEQVAAAAKSYGARYIKVYPMPAVDSNSPEQETKGDNYDMQHTTRTYLVGPDGKSLVTFPHGTTADIMAERILRFIKKKTS